MHRFSPNHIGMNKDDNSHKIFVFLFGFEELWKFPKSYLFFAKVLVL